METLKAQYKAFDAHGIRYYECKKKVKQTWVEWIGTSDEVWKELYHAYYVEKNFNGIKASPIVDLDEFGQKKGKSHLKRKREGSESSGLSDHSPRSIDYVMRDSAIAKNFQSMTSSEDDQAAAFLVAEALTEMRARPLYGTSSCQANHNRPTR